MPTTDLAVTVHRCGRHDLPLASRLAYLARLRLDEPTRAYAGRRTAEGLSKRVWGFRMLHLLFDQR